MRQYTVPKSILYATRYNAQNVHLAKYATKCYKNASKFFPDVEPPELINKKLPYGKRLKILLIDQYVDRIKNLLDYYKGEMV